MAGVTEASPEFFVELRKVCDEVGAVLIFDEVQTGIGRTGTWFFAGSENAGEVVPDIITLAKSLGSGVPVGACLVNDTVSGRISLNDLGTTFGGGMLAMSAVLATLEAIEQDNMLSNAVSVEQQIRSAMANIDGVKAVHGKGCLIGIEFYSAAKTIHEKLLNDGIITGTSSSPNVLRLLPPINLTASEIDYFISALNVILTEASSSGAA
jgi:acetylornithine/succinyldiaminopimelate/putrescine aminotransferase